MTRGQGRYDIFYQARADAERAGYEPNELCGALDRETRTLCEREAGRGTDHPGVGKCSRHGGNRMYERTKAAMLMGHSLGKELSISPWEALLKAVRISAGMAAWYQARLDEVDESDHDAFLPGGTAYPVVQGLERANQDTARYAKMAIDAGVSKILVERVQVQAMQLGKVINGVLDSLADELDDAAMARVRAALRVQLTELDASGWAEPQPIRQLPAG